MKDYHSKNIINTALEEHASSGKTIISEIILYNNKVTQK
jgi:translation elongation factor EF-G